MLTILFKLLGSLALLIYGMKTMSEALQKMAGPQLRHVLGAMTTNRFTGMLTGVGVTAAVQSSTATTVMTVSFVNAGLLTLAQAISVIMGANIGTTLTAWIISAGTSFNITNAVFPAFIVAMLLIYKKRHRIVGDFIFGVAFLLLGLGTLRQTGSDMQLGQNETVMQFFSSFDPNAFSTTLIFLLLGGLLTMCVQSSAAIMAITMMLCSSGVMPIYQGIALVMGENIGTTVTSNLAAMTASTEARRAAFAHMFFNLFGVAWMIVVLHPFVDLICSIVGTDMSFVLAAFHTGFNVINTGILIWFIPQIERFVCFVIQPRKTAATGSGHLRFIEGGLMATPEISVLQAQKEITLMAERMQQMFGLVRTLLDERDRKEQERLHERIDKYEELSDSMEIEIANYLDRVSRDHLSDDTKGKIRSMLRQISELESIGDACSSIARSIRRTRESREDFTAEQYGHLHEMLRLTSESIVQMMVVVSGRRDNLSLDLSKEIESDINTLRDRLKTQNIQDVNAHLYSYAIGTYYIDIVSACEKLGDYVINVVEARLGRPALRFKGLVVNTEQKTVSIDGTEVSLTRIEFMLLRLLLAHRGEVFSRQQLMERVWHDVVVSDRTVDVSMTRLRKKLGPYAPHIANRPGFGYYFLEDKAVAPTNPPVNL